MLTGKRQLTTMAAATSKADSKKKGKGPWMTATEEKLSQAIALGVRSSSKEATREFRVEFYLKQLTKAKLEVAYYEEMLQLEERQSSFAVTNLETELRLLTLRGEAGQLRGGQAARAADDDDDDEDDDGTVVPDLSVRVPVKGDRW
jgi:hypothetical protein